MVKKNFLAPGCTLVHVFQAKKIPALRGFQAFMHRPVLERNIIVKITRRHHVRHVIALVGG